MTVGSAIRRLTLLQALAAVVPCDRVVTLEEIRAELAEMGVAVTEETLRARLAYLVRHQQIEQFGDGYTQRQAEVWRFPSEVP